ncbi:glutamate receptor ionotropic, kainate 5-like isoform X2 [Dunckerocampus dactyliophorus]|uniref:glutamate receptor ionotropic, kainate 5-like isoform X2 n=1 Tax=Dunckerocampus dactyliophorus TaxID=161453 RepID=UPI002404C2F0|nr:glutamate receptor ionotropic, kainate 5-like isoform X2 [Dunckerocampus dactyliophorus]
MPPAGALLLSIDVLVLLTSTASARQKEDGAISVVRLAAILDDQPLCGRGERLALALASKDINGWKGVSAQARVEVDPYDLLSDSQYDTTETMCQILPKGVVAVIGPASSPASASTISHICAEKEVPYVKISPEETSRLPYLHFASVALRPSDQDLSLAIGSVLRSFGNPPVSLICAKAECLQRLEELVCRFLISRETLSVRVLERDLDPTPLLKEIRDDKVGTIVVDTDASLARRILGKAGELGMTSAFYTYILTTMDFPLLDLDALLVQQPTIMGFSILDSNHPSYRHFLRSLSVWWRDACTDRPYPGLPLSAAMMFDAVHVVTSAVRELNRSQEMGVKPLGCGSPVIWQHGTSLMNYLRMVEYDGLTGHIEFNSKGQRSNYTLNVLEKHPGGHRQIGTWYSNNTLSMKSSPVDLKASQTLANKTLVVTTILENPYVMRKSNFQDYLGNEQYEGFCVDMLRELADILKFSFTIKLVDDGLYGAPDPNGSWTGMVGELMNRKADLAVAGFTITSEREKVIDFSKPFMTLGISILYRVHLVRAHFLYFAEVSSCLLPGGAVMSVCLCSRVVSQDISPSWIRSLQGCGSSCCWPTSPSAASSSWPPGSMRLFLCGFRLSPDEWHNQHACPWACRDILENQYTLGNSLWFPVGGFMQQGSEVMPRALSTRCVSGVWWAFTLIIISSYTANLAAFLTVQRMEAPIESADDLADQTDIQYGTIHGGSTMTFFMNSRYQTYQRMWTYMHSKQPSVFVKTTEDGIARVLNSRYAFLMESTMNEYYRRLDCNLTQIGDLLDTKGYGIGMPLGSPYRQQITLGVLQLQESNRLEVLKRRWWEGGHCPKEEDHRATGLGMENIGGIFVVLMCGLITAVMVAIMEFVWSTHRTVQTDEVSLCHEMLLEFGNAVLRKRSSRPRRRRPLSYSGGQIQRGPARLSLGPARLSLGPARPTRLVRDMRLSNGRLCGSGGLLTRAGLVRRTGGGPDWNLGTGPQRILQEPLGTVHMPPPVSAMTALPVMPHSFLRSCSHMRVCRECRRIQSLTLPPPRPPASSQCSSCPRTAASGLLRHLRYYRSGTMSLPRLPPLTPDRIHSPPQSKAGRVPPPRPRPSLKVPRLSLDLVGAHN